MSYYYGVEGTPNLYTLCGFCDASLHAYAAVVYLVIESNINTELKFLVSKTRVTPLQIQTIPRLELLSAFLLSKLITSVREGLSSTIYQLAVRCYTDSLVAPFWIRGTNKPFVSSEIRPSRSLESLSWFFKSCTHTFKRFDLAGLSVSQLWRCGPEWLQAGFEPNV